MASGINPDRYRYHGDCVGGAMSNQTCTTCDYLRAENAALRQKVTRLETSLSRAWRVIGHQKNQLDAARLICWDYIQKARQAMVNHLPRGTWALWRGRSETASAVYGPISTDYGTGMLAEIASLLGGRL